MSTPPFSDVPNAAQVVIIGGGVIGCSVAYHLTLRGWTDVLVLERDQLGCGSTWHAHGLVGLLRATPNLTRLALHTNEVLPQLEVETGLSTGFKQNGSVIVASDEDHLEQLQRLSVSLRRLGLILERISLHEAAERWPLVETRDLKGAFFMAEEGQTNPLDTVLAYAKAARMRGAKIVEHMPVTGILRENGRVVGVSSEAGDIAAEYVVDCSGVWGWQTGAMAGVNTPVLALQQSYIVTEPMPHLSPNRPMFRDYQAGIGVREDALQLTIGIPSPEFRPWGVEKIPDGFSFAELPDDWSDFESTFERMLHRIPALADIGIRKLLTGPDPYSPDSLFFFGESPELAHYFVANGMSGVGVGSSGGIGSELAAWIVDGEPTMDLWEVDVRRFMPFQRGRQYQLASLSGGGSALFDVFWPHHQISGARGVRRSALHERMKQAGAHFDCCAGWEIPGWYVTEPEARETRKTYQRQPWFGCWQAEHVAASDGMGLFDQSALSKFIIQGENAAAVLNRICANDIDADPGTVVPTLLLDRSGGIYASVEVHRLQTDRFMLVAAPGLQTKLEVWLDRHLANTSAVLTDATSQFAVLGLYGPRSQRWLASAISSEPIDLPNRTFRGYCIGSANTRVVRNDSGGLSVWAVYLSTEFAVGVYDFLMHREMAASACHIGAHARNGLLIESGGWHRIARFSAPDTPGEVGLTHTLAFGKKAGFIGEESVRRQLEGGVTERFIQVRLLDPDPLLFGNEVLWCDGESVGYVRTATYGHLLGGAIAVCHLTNEDRCVEAVSESDCYEIEIGDRRFAARLFRPPAE